MHWMYLLTAAGAWLGFANPLLRIPVLVLLFPLGLCLLALKAPTGKAAFKSGWIAGTLAYTGCLYWIVIPVWYYGGVPFALAAPCPVLVAMYTALFTGLFSLCFSYGARRLPPAAAGLLAGVLWAGLEYVRGFLFTGFPWVPLASALSPWPWAIGLVSVSGAYGFGGILAAVGAWLALGGRGTGQGKWDRLTVALALLVLGLLPLYGAATVPAGAPTTGISIVQGNVDQSLKWDEAVQAKTVDDYLALSRREIEEHRPEVVVWPETAMPFFLQDDTPQSRRVRLFAAETGTPVVTGAPAYAPMGTEYAYFNRAFLIGPDGRLRGEYAKAHLVPFGEYVPLGRYLTFIGKLVQSMGEFLPGVDPRPLRTGNLAMGMLICYETIFPELAQERVEAGANVLVNISNDAWFGRSSAPRQHLDMSVLRAVEQGRWLVRSTNTGISTIIDPSGRTLTQSGLYEPARIHESVGLVSGTTPFHRGYTYIHPAILAAAVLLMLLARLSGRRVPTAAGVSPKSSNVPV